MNSQTVGSCSAGYIKPSWQNATGVPNDHLRDLPDISLFASNGFLGSFYVICQQDITGGCYLGSLAGYGGTSVASPAFAGIMSLVNQKMGTPQGVPGFALYKLVSKQANAFHDTPSGSTISMPCFAGSPNCTVTTAGHQFGVLSGYSTTTGYDLATGLGSVDATNLVNNWSKATFTATSATLQMNSGTAVNVTHGTAVPVSIAVNPTAASGKVSLLVSAGTGTTTGQAVDGFALAGGSTAAGTTTSLLPAGTYNVIAHYGGDGTYGGSYSSPVSVTVSKENSSVMLSGVTLQGTTAPVTTFSYDSQYFVRADVGNSKGAKCTPFGFGEVACPTGSLIFTVDGQQTNFNNFALNSEGSTETWVGAIPAISGGTHSLGAQYTGDNNYNANTGAVSITVTKAATQTTQVTAQGAITQPVTLTTFIQDPNASPILPTPSGNVTFYSNGTALPGTTSYGSGSNGVFFYSTASLSTTFATPGTYSISASYAGDQNYQASSVAATPITLLYPQPTTSATPTSQVVLSGTPVTVTVTVDTANKVEAPSGTVTLGEGNLGTIGSPTTCTQIVDSNGNYACQAIITFTPPSGDISSYDFFWAIYSGDSNYPASQSGPYSVSISDFSLSSNSYQVSLKQGQSQTTGINVGDVNGFTGTVTNFNCSGLPAEATCSFNPATVTPGGSTTLTISTAPIGQIRRRAARNASSMQGLAGTFAPLLGICFVGIFSIRKRRPLAALLSIMAMAILVSCGGSGGGGGGQTGPNPVPSVTSLSPTQQAAGSASQLLVINGTGFLKGSSVTFNGSSRTAAFLSSSQLEITLGPTDLNTLGTYPVVVTNPAPGGGASTAMDFDVVSGTPLGSFSVSVTATSGSVSHSAPINLIVQ